MDERFDAIILQIVNTLVRNKVATPNDINYCTKDEIDEIEFDMENHLPLFYRMFLATMGRGAGRYFEGTDIFFPSMLGLNLAARDLLRNTNSRLTLPVSAVVFLMHQGYQFMFMLSDEGNDPPVYYYIEGASEYICKFNKLSSYLLSSARDSW